MFGVVAGDPQGASQVLLGLLFLPIDVKVDAHQEKDVGIGRVFGGELGQRREVVLFRLGVGPEAICAVKSDFGPLRIKLQARA